LTCEKSAGGGWGRTSGWLLASLLQMIDQNLFSPKMEEQTKH
jgi:hypothetical protein